MTTNETKIAIMLITSLTAVAICTVCISESVWVALALVSVALIVGSIAAEGAK